MIDRTITRLKNYDYSQNGAYFITMCTKNKQNLLWSVCKTVCSVNCNADCNADNVCNADISSVGARIARPSYCDTTNDDVSPVGARIARPPYCDATNDDVSPVGARIARPPYCDTTNETTQLPPDMQLTAYGKIIDDAINEICKHYPCVNVDKYVIMPNHIHMILMLSNDDGRAVRAPTVDNTKVNVVVGNSKVNVAVGNSKVNVDDGRAVRAPTVGNVINQLKGHVTKQIGLSVWQKLFYDRVIRNKAEYNQIWNYIDTNPIKWQNDCFYVIYD